MKISKQANGETWVELPERGARVKLQRDCRVTNAGLLAPNAPAELIEQFVLGGRWCRNGVVGLGGATAERIGPLPRSLDT